MKSIRLVVAAISSIMLTVGYLASQNAALNGQAKEYAQNADKPAVVYLSLLVFLVALVLFALPDRKEPEE